MKLTIKGWMEKMDFNENFIYDLKGLPIYPTKKKCLKSLEGYERLVPLKITLTIKTEKEKK